MPNLNNIIFPTLISSIVAVWCFAPAQLSDQNQFLKDFVSKDFISFFGIFVSISVGVAGTLHLELNRYEEARGELLFEKTKGGLQRSITMMGWTFVASLIIVLLKHAPYMNQEYSVHFNGTAVLCCLFAAWQLLDIVRAVFLLPPKLPRNGHSQRPEN